MQPTNGRFLPSPLTTQRHYRHSTCIFLLKSNRDCGALCLKQVFCSEFDLYLRISLGPAPHVRRHRENRRKGLASLPCVTCSSDCRQRLVYRRGILKSKIKKTPTKLGYIPIRATGNASCCMLTTVSIALATSGKAHTAALSDGGLALSFTVAAVITPNVPSDPTKSSVML